MYFFYKTGNGGILSKTRRFMLYKICGLANLGLKRELYRHSSIRLQYDPPLYKKPFSNAMKIVTKAKCDMYFYKDE